MSDLRLRELERAALAGGDGEAVARLLHVRHRAGALEQNRLKLLAALGVPAARELLRSPPPLLSLKGNLWANGGWEGRPPWAPWKRAFRNAGRVATAQVVDALLQAWYPDWEAEDAVPGELVFAFYAWAQDPSAHQRVRVEALWKGLDRRFRTRIWRLRYVDRALRLKTLSIIADPLMALRETLFSISLPVWGNAPQVIALTEDQRLDVVRNVLLKITLRPALPSRRRLG
jgi:hypothetical protein